MQITDRVPSEQASNIDFGKRSKEYWGGLCELSAEYTQQAKWIAGPRDPSYYV